MITLKDKSRRSARPGYLVKAVRGGFDIAETGDTPIGVLFRPIGNSRWIIQDTGTADVMVEYDVIPGDEVRMAVEGEGGRAGTVRKVGTATSYTSIGRAIGKGKGLVEVALNISSGSVGSGSSGISEAPIDGSVYGRLNATWSVVSSGISDAVADNVAYSRRNNAWVNSNLIIDRSGGTGAATAIVNYDERLTIVGDGTYISSTYTTYVNALSQTIHQIAISLAPGALDTRWDLMTADGQVATARPYTTVQIGNTANVAFLDGVYTTVGYALNNVYTDYNPNVTEPVNEVTVDIDLTSLYVPLDLRYAALSGNATQSWVTSNFDNYANWIVEAAGVPVQTVSSGNAVNFAAGSNMTVTWGGPDTLTFAMTTAFGTMSSWNWRILGVNHSIAR